MADGDKEEKPILGLGLPEYTNDLNAWRPCKAARRVKSGPSLTDAAAEKPKMASQRESTKAADRETESKSNSTSDTTENRERKPDATAWRPSKVNEERLRSLSPARGRKRLALSPRTRLIFTAVLFACGAYFFVRVWLMPQAGELHVALVVAGAAMVLLFVSAIVGASRRRRAKRADDKSILRL